MEVTLRDGRKLVKYVEHALGSLKRPLSNAELDEKFRRLCAPHLKPGQSDELIELCRTLTRLPDAAQLARAAGVH